MKKLIITITLCLMILNGWSQAVLEHTYPSRNFYGPAKLTNYGWVYSLIPYNNPLVLEVYTVNHTLIKTIPLPIPTGYQLYSFCGISDNLFNLDNKIEVLYSYYKYTPSVTSNLVLYNEDGSLLQFFSGQCYGYTFNIDGSYKLETQAIYADSTTSIYSLPGTMVDIPNQNNQSDMFSLYPNPCSDHLSIDLLSYPASLTITDMMGHIIAEQKLMSSTTSINTSGFNPGQYIYSIKTSLGKVSTGKVTVVK